MFGGANEPIPRVRLAAAQGIAVPGAIATNVATAARLVAQAGAQGARVVVLPEAFLTGYDFSTFAGPLPAQRDLDGPVFDPLRAAAAAADCTAVVGTALKRTAERVLSVVVIRPDGTTLAPYDKQHLDGEEKQYFSVGEHGTSLLVDGVAMGLSICYDACFSEHARAAADAGALAYLAGAAFPRGAAQRCHLYYGARAIENGFYVVSSQMTGPKFNGGSTIYAPDGSVAARLGKKEGVIVADLDPLLLAATRARHTMHADHRASLGEQRLI